MTSTLSTRSILSTLRHSVVKLHSEFAQRTRELATGQHHDLGLKLGARSGYFVSLRTERMALESMTNTNSLVSARLDATESKLETIQVSAREALNSLLASGLSVANAASIEAVGKARLSSLISELDSSFGEDYLFAGTNTGTRPIVDYAAPSSPAKIAVDSAFFTGFGFSQSSPSVAEISGADMAAFLDTRFAALFRDPNWAATWSSAADEERTDRISPTLTEKTSVSANALPFRQLAEAYTMLADLGTNNLGVDAFHTVLDTAVSVLQTAIDGLTDLRANVGIVQAKIENASERMSLQVSLLEKHAGQLANVDTYEVSVRLTELQTQLEASYSLTARLSALSLAHYL